MDASEFMVENNITCESELFAIVDEQKKAEKKDLADFVLSRSTKALSDLLENTRKMESASKNVFRSEQTCMEKTHEDSHESCADSCSAEWLNCALEVLHENNIYPPSYFSAAVRKLLQMGRGNSRNIIGRENCAKTLLLIPLELLIQFVHHPTM